MAHTDGRTTHDIPAALPPLGADTNGVPHAADPPATVTLRRLIGLATLTPPQAVHIASEILGLLDSSTGLVGADTDSISVGANGAVRLSSGQPGRDAAATADVVDQLTRNADRPVARRNPASAALLTALARCAAALREGDLVAARAALVPATRAGGLDEQQARRELAALVTVAVRPTVALRSPAITERPRVRPEPRPAQQAAPSTPRTAQPSPHATRARRRVITTIVIAALAVVGVISTIALVRPGGSSPNGGTSAPPTSSTHTGANAGRHRSSPAGTHRHAIPTLAPAAARGISRVTLTPAARCRRGTSCVLTVRVWLRPPWLTAFHWHAAAVNRCTGHVRRIGSGSMIAGPGWRSAYATVRLRVPDKPRVALLAVVDRPVAAASRPLLVTTGTRGCG